MKQRQPMTDVRAQLEYALRARNQTPVMSIRAARSALRNAIDHEDKPRVLFERAEILRQWPTRAVSSVGRKPKFDWDAIRAEACRLMDHHGEFHSTDPEWRAQASLEVALKGFCAEKWDKEPADSTLRERLRPWLAAWRADKRAVGN